MLFTFPRTVLAVTLALSFPLAAYSAEPHKQIQADAQQYKAEAAHGWAPEVDHTR